MVRRSRTIAAKMHHFGCWSAGLVLLAVMPWSGCSWRLRQPKPAAPAPPPITVAVAPAMNLSGSTDFEPLRVADLMASELTQIRGVRVIGVNRVLAVLARDRLTAIESPMQAVQVARELGADVILMFAITEYDPHEPPIVGMAAQLYAVPVDTRDATWDPVAASRALRPPLVRIDLDPSVRPRAESQKVFNAAQKAVAKDVLRFADERDAGGSPFGPRLYLVSQEHFLRYCCYATGRELLDRYRGAAPPAEPRMEETG